MKILFLSYAESHSNKWVNALCAKGHDVYFVMQKNVVNQVNELDNRIKIIFLPITGKGGYFLNACALKKIYKKIEPDVVNVHYASGYGTMARLAGIKRELLSVWGSDVYDFPYINWINMRIIKKNLLHAEQIASTSNCMALQVKKLISNKKKITITPFGINIDEFDPMKFAGKKSEDIVIGNIKVISPKYGIDDLIKAFALLRKDLKKDTTTATILPKLKCKIYGPGEQSGEIQKLIDNYGLRCCVELLGEIKHSKVPEILSTFDIFCATSVLDSESFGVSVVEAEAMAIPVVVTDVDGFKEVVEDNVSGIIVERRNVFEIAGALKKLVLNKKMRLQMGEQGRKRVIKYYNFENNVETMERIYKEIAKGE